MRIFLRNLTMRCGYGLTEGSVRKVHRIGLPVVGPTMVQCIYLRRPGAHCVNVDCFVAGGLTNIVVFSLTSF